MTARELAGILNAKCVGPDRWQGRCPAHPDRNASLSISACRDDRVLLYCFAGCEPEEIYKGR
jgi:hypothetical protein